MTKNTKGLRNSECTLVIRSAAAMCLITACALDQAKPTIDDEVSFDEQPIIGGVTDNGDFGVYGLSVHPPGVSAGVSCTCTQIDPRTCLTAAHCVDPRVIGTGQVFEILAIRPGVNRRFPAFSPSFDPLWDPSNPQNGHDFGAVYNNLGDFVFYPRRSVDPTLPVRLVGYGANTHSNTGVGTLRTVTVPVVSVSDRLIRAGNSDAQACHGDSGGPVFQIQNGVEVLVGITSFGTDRPPQVCFDGSFHVRIESDGGFISQVASCGDGICQTSRGENASWCPVDCGFCGDGWCVPSRENVSSCPQDCHCGNGLCDQGEDPSSCPFDCGSCLSDTPSLLCFSGSEN